jgi:hypothetical protein
MSKVDCWRKKPKNYLKNRSRVEKEKTDCKRNILTRNDAVIHEDVEE